MTPKMRRSLRAAILLPLAVPLVMALPAGDAKPTHVATQPRPPADPVDQLPPAEHLTEDWCPDLIVLPPEFNRAVRAAYAAREAAAGVPPLPAELARSQESTDEHYMNGGRAPGRYRTFRDDPDPTDDVIPCVATRELLGPPPSLPMPSVPSRGRP